MPILAGAQEQRKSANDGIAESKEDGLVVLSPADKSPFRRILYVDGYGGASMWEKIKKGEVPSHHLRGCLELVRMGYEVALAEPLPDVNLRRRPVPHDLRLLKMVRSWLKRGDIVYCGHNLLFWLPLLNALGMLGRPIVSHLFGREDLPVSRGHNGIIGLTPAAAEQGKRLAPHAKVVHLGWGTDLSSFPKLAYRPEAFFSCGITLRDHRTLSLAAARCRQRIEVICPGVDGDIKWPANVRVTDGGRGWNVDDKKVSYNDLLYKHYARSSGSLIILKNHRFVQQTAPGFTELIEAMAMARPVIITRTPALADEIDVEGAGWGLFVPMEDPDALSEAIDFLGDNPSQAEEMGRRGRRLAERHYNMERYARDLHKFFESL
ncbi:MAG TPA: glycosyltransferase [Candidatus Sulfotelmatobacter sp.]|nr:glycosyltransferase [Candidatus Sulfotelmatobacter sp.]